DVIKLHTQVRGQLEVARAALGLSSAPAQAKEQLVQLAAQPDPTGSIGADAIRTLGKAGDKQGAARAAQLASAANPGAEAQLLLAAALFDVGADDAAAAAMARAERGPLTPAQEQSLIALRAGSAVRAADRLNESGNQSAAYDALRPALANAPNDPATQLALSRLYQGSRQPTQAQRIAETVLARNPRDWEARRTAVDAALAAGDNARAETLANEAQMLQPGDSRGMLMKAKVARAKGETANARQLLAQAAAQREQELGRGEPKTERAQVASADNPFAGTVTDVQNAALPLDAVSREIAEEARLARQENGPRIAGAPSFRSRSGTSGLGSLTELGGSVEANGRLGNIPGRFSAQVSPITIDSGKATEGWAVRQFGTNAAFATAIPNRDTAQLGAALTAGYQYRELVSADIGSSPLGFRTTNVVGGLEFAPKLTDNLRLRLRAGRRMVTDSVTSYAGSKDPVTGQVWGGVTQTGGRGQLELGVGAGTAYLYGGYASLNGKNVASNTRHEAGAGISYPLLRRGDSVLTSGLDVTYFAYDNNQNNFTFGQGGYFSPQNYVAVSLPVEYSSHAGKLGYTVGGAIGYAHFREDPNLVFPNNPLLQAQLEAASRRDPNIPTHTPGQTKNGLIGGARVELSYPLTEQMTLIGAARYDRAADFQETRVSVRLESRF
ncbi:MAG TPA: cellulose synthase subunit BcsC-related outer membrane protein, partial [Sphingomonas sp.]|nr:cellulose synthase subunit BcsC-related outer membrane protein [Sphingomonas sp.]